MAPGPTERQHRAPPPGTARLAAAIAASGLRVVLNVALGPYRLDVVAPEVLAAVEVDCGLERRLATRRALLLTGWGLLHVESVPPADVPRWSADHLLDLPRVEPHALRRVGKAADHYMARVRYGGRPEE